MTNPGSNEIKNEDNQQVLIEILKMKGLSLDELMTRDDEEMQNMIMQLLQESEALKQLPQAQEADNQPSYPANPENLPNDQQQLTESEMEGA